MLPRLRAVPRVAALLAAAGLSGALGLGLVAPAAAATADPRPGASAPSAMPASGTFYPTAPQRVLGTPTGGYAVSPGTPAAVTTVGRPGLPSSGVSALMVNVLVTTGASEVGLAFAGAGQPAPAPLVTVPAATTRATLLTVPLATTSGFDVHATGGAATVTADVVGFYAADDTIVAGYGLSGGYQPVDPTRLSGPDAVVLAPGGRTLLAVDLGSTVTPHASALLVGISTGAAAPPSGAGSLSVSASTAPGEGGVLPTTVAFGPGAPAANLALVPAELDSSGRLGVAVTNTGTAPATFTLDLVGFYDDGAIGPTLRFRPLPQSRVVDTAAGLGVATTPGTPTGASTPAAASTPASSPGAGSRATPGDGVVGDSSFALVGVLTATATAPTGVGVDSPDDAATAATVLPVAAGTTSLAVQPEVGVGRDLALRTGSAASPAALSGLTLDVVGSFEASPAVTNPASRAWVPAVPAWQITASLQSS